VGPDWLPLDSMFAFIAVINCGIGLTVSVSYLIVRQYFGANDHIYILVKVVKIVTLKADDLFSR
jgi:hypothetical protein